MRCRRSSPWLPATLIALMLLAACSRSPQTTSHEREDAAPDTDRPDGGRDALAPPGSADATAARDRAGDQARTQDGPVDAPMADTAADASVLPDGAATSPRLAAAPGSPAATTVRARRTAAWGAIACPRGSVSAGAGDLRRRIVRAVRRHRPALLHRGGISQVHAAVWRLHGRGHGWGRTGEVCRACGRLGDPCCEGQDHTCVTTDGEVVCWGDPCPGKAMRER
jgi:hypothetical protein